MTFEEYPLRIPNIKSIEKKVNSIIEQLKNVKSKEEELKVIYKYFKWSDKISSDITVIQIRNSINTLDPVYEKAMEKINEISPIIQSLTQQVDLLIFNSKNKEYLVSKLGKHYFDMLEASFKTFNDTIIEECIEENKLITAYDKLMASADIEFKGEHLNLTMLGKYLSSKDRKEREEASRLYYGYIEEHDKEFGEIYSKLVLVRDRMAKKMGFKNYVDFGYLRLGRTDYNSEDVKGYRDQIIKDVVPFVLKLKKRQAKRINIKSPLFYDFNLDFLSGNPTSKGNSEYLVNVAKNMYNDMSKESGEFFSYMVNNHLMDLDAKKGKAGGGYCTYIPLYKAPFIFANSNGTSGDVDTLTHEVGHAFQAYLASNIKNPSLRSPTLEACEIDSMSMEFFAYPYMEDFFKEDKDKYLFSHLSGAISFLPYGAEVDDFQHFVYENPTCTHEERCAYWAKIDKIYRPWMNYKGFSYLDSGHMWIRQHHIYSTAFYYIDYTLAQVLALEFKNEFEKNKEKTWKKYIKLLKMGGKYPFLELIKKDHLLNPFIDGNIKKIMKPSIKQLNSIDDLKF